MRFFYFYILVLLAEIVTGPRSRTHEASLSQATAVFAETSELSSRERAGRRYAARLISTGAARITTRHHVHAGCARTHARGN